MTLLTAPGGGAAVATAYRRVEAPLGPYAWARYSRAFARACDFEADTVDVIHNHGLWLHPNHVAAATSRRRRKPLVTSPRGMLSPWARRRSRLRKSLVWSLWERRNLETARVLHASSDSEASDIRGAGLGGPIAVIANGVDTDVFKPGAADDVPERREVLFLGRLHEAKGYDTLLTAWEAVGTDGRGRLALAGPGERADLDELERRMGASRPGSVAYLGVLGRDEKIERLRRAWALVLPSRTESYGMAVAEALACGVPVVASRNAPWRDIEERECGWWVEPSPAPLAAALREALSLSATDRRRMGMRARELAVSKHSLSEAGRRMAATYAWILGGGIRPDWVTV